MLSKIHSYTLLQTAFSAILPTGKKQKFSFVEITFDLSFEYPIYLSLSSETKLGYRKKNNYNRQLTKTTNSNQSDCTFLMSRDHGK